MRFETLDAWLEWQESLNPRGIELGLDRVRRVLERMDLLDPPFRVLTVGGTNGKGSVASYAASIFQAEGITTGRYLSPHVLRYNERVAVNGIDVSDDELCEAFDVVDRARADEPLTYFEFGTLAAFEVFRRREVDVAVLEVGLGGRLDAVNAVDPDVAVVVSVGLDHVDWLGHDVESIAREKAGIFRREKPAIFGSLNRPRAIDDEARRLGACLESFGESFRVELHGETWTLVADSFECDALPVPPLAGEHQLANAATAIMAVRHLEPNVSIDSIRRGIAATRLPGRLQRLAGTPATLLDVGHNPDAAAHIAAFLRNDPRPTVAVLGMLADKDAAGFVRELVPQVAEWHLASLAGARGQSADALAERLSLAGLDLRVHRHSTVVRAFAAASAAAGPDGRVLVAGSFHTVADFLVYFEGPRDRGEQRAGGK